MSIRLLLLLYTVLYQALFSSFGLCLNTSVLMIFDEICLFLQVLIYGKPNISAL